MPETARHEDTLTMAKEANPDKKKILVVVWRQNAVLLMKINFQTRVGIAENETKKKTTRERRHY